MKFVLKENLDTISYWFGEDSGAPDFEYEVTLDDEYRFIDALFHTYSKETLEDILKDFLHEECPEYDSLSLEEQTEALKDVLYEHLDKFDEDAEEFFRDDAYELYQDTEEYRKNPYAYNGVDAKDFY